jgi:beta-lactamase superfamily II metal-dependent hydrolase
MTRTLKISMFEVGFGDCFLLEIPTANGLFRALFDCGRHTGGDAKNQEVADAVIAAATDPSGTPRIDLVIGTHRHKDHVSGFKMKGWDKVSVREVWMPWTEDPTDPDARGLVDRQLAAAGAAAAALQAAPGLTPLDAKIAGVVDLALTNEGAMDTLYHGFSGDPQRRYLPERVDPQRPLTIAGFPEIRFHIMGPPRAEATLGRMEPPTAETFKRLAAALGGASDAPIKPFDRQWLAGAKGNPLLDASDRKMIDGLAVNASLLNLSAAIDNAINNTSLVIMVEVGSAWLLFCADAQWGNWQTILAEQHWREVIGKTTFLKVGHHASHNASPVTLVDKLLPKNIPAMVSVDTSAYPPSVPFKGLLDEFAVRQFEVARSDLPNEAPARFDATPKLTTLELDF